MFNGFVHLSEASSLAMHALAVLAREAKDKPLSVQELSERFGFSSAHLAKVLLRLSKARLVHSIRGPKGGFQLAKSPETITLLDIYQIMEGPVALTNCILATPLCGWKNCIFGGLLGQIQQQVQQYLTQTTLYTLATANEQDRDEGPIRDVEVSASNTKLSL